MHEPTRASLLRVLPKVDRLLASAELAPLLARHPRTRVLQELRAVLEGLRRHAAAGTLAASALTPAAISERLSGALEIAALPYYRQVINATGVVLHTGIGRAGLAAPAVAALAALSGGGQRLEIDLETGDRGGRDEGCARLLRELTGAEAATVVNNNAAATLLILAALARGRKVLLSRGELVEIGGSFRIPDVLSESGARLVEVGTTNRTHLADYRNALDPPDHEVGMILKVHTSNYRILGFTCEVEIAELAQLGREHGIPVVHDLGSGCLLDLASRGLPGESLVRHSIAAGADLVCFSGDKLLGGPQSGLLAGRRDAVDRCRRHPLMRALRPGRLTYTALEATLRLYHEETAPDSIPTLRRLLADPAALRRRAQKLARLLRPVAGLTATITPCASQAGSGSLPARDLPSWGVRLTTALPAAGLARHLRTGVPAILPRIADDAVLLDVRTLDDAELAVVAQRLTVVCSAVFRDRRQR
jgi:L-seryl-tRNA(Ser) seleniumtransferase